MQKSTDSGGNLARLAFNDSDLDRHSEWRGQPATLQALLDRTDARFIGVEGDAVSAVSGSPDYRRPNGLGSDTALFLGSDPGECPWFAYAAPAGAELLQLRPLLMSGALPAAELSRFAQARSLVHWHQSHRFCARCGLPSVMQDGGYRRHCPSCGGDHFPRTDPVVIMAIVHGDHVLLGRQAAWPEKMYSCLAGFMEPGETIEQAVARETFEETGVRVHSVSYVASQPWPFPSSLMIGMRAEAHGLDITIDYNELQDARWFSKADARLMLSRQHPDGLSAASPYAIAHWLIRDICQDAPDQR
jgi:NAD+ diphosphatase